MTRIRYGMAAKEFNWKEGHGVVGQRGIDFGSPELLSASALSVSLEYGVDAIEVVKDTVKGEGRGRRPGRRSHSQWVHISRNATLRRKWWRKRTTARNANLSVMHPRGSPVTDSRRIYDGSTPGFLSYIEKTHARSSSPENIQAAL